MSDDNSPKTEPAPTLTPQQVVDIVNSAITSHMKRLPDPKALITEALASFKPANPAPVEEEVGKKGKDAETAALRAKVEELQKQYAQAEDARKAAESRQREDRAYSELRNALSSKVRPEAVDTVAKVLFHADKRVELDESGNAFLKVKRAPAPGLAEEDTLLPLADGVEHYLKSKDAQMFLPAPSSNNSNSNPPSRGGRMPLIPSPKPGSAPKYDSPATTDEEKIRRAMEWEQTIEASQK